MTTDSMAFQVLQNALAASNLKQQVYANNIANADTPGFKRSDVQFETVLQNALTGGDSSKLTRLGTPSSSNYDSLNWTMAQSVQPEVVVDNTTTVDNNGNNVNVDDEMVSLAQNQLRYNVLTEDMSERLSRLQTAINGG